ncbi:hypothetical protein BDV29DRAFT_179502 [Aspergillus leporis]|uniref:Uncharacterized protein n=1 Tax=Aspergillus leporis TaxID=41062 RepID=A0A5N5WS62_9EURO|nr:hypothetical protein BDV29DRAFT_179502 [Aspergillus leporis]
MVEQNGIEPVGPEAECSSTGPSRKAGRRSWMANISARLHTENKQLCPPSPPSDSVPTRPRGDTSHHEATSPVAEIWQSSQQRSKCVLRTPLDVQPNTSDVPKAAVESAGSESEFVSCTDEVSLKAFLERIRQERGTEPLELFTVCFGERGVDLNVHIKGELVLSLLV